MQESIQIKAFTGNAQKAVSLETLITCSIVSSSKVVEEAFCTRPWFGSIWHGRVEYAMVGLYMPWYGMVGHGRVVYAMVG